MITFSIHHTAFKVDVRWELCFIFRSYFTFIFILSHTLQFYRNNTYHIYKDRIHNFIIIIETRYLILCQILLRLILLLDCNSHVTSFLVIKINLLSFPFIENENMFSKDYHNLRKDNIHRRRSWRTWIESCEKIYCL